MPTRGVFLCQYDFIENVIIEELGDPIKLKDGEAFTPHGESIDSLFRYKRMANTFQATYEYKYSEWVFKTDSGIVVIDHSYFYTKIDDATYRHVIEYTYSKE